MNDLEKTGDYIRSIRRSKNLTQEQLADIIHVDNKSISLWENGRVEISGPNLDKLAKALNVSRAEIEMGQDMNELDPESKAELDRRLRETDNVTINLEDMNILSLGIAVAALGVSIIAMAVALWGVGKQSTLLLIICWLNGMLGFLFIVGDPWIIKILEGRLEERKRKISKS